MLTFRRAIVLALCFASGAALAAIQDAPGAIQADPARQVQRRGPETLHPVRVDRHAFAGARPGEVLVLPGNGSGRPMARFDHLVPDGPRRWTWIGKVDTAVGEQSVVITFGDDAVFGTLPQRLGPPLRIETRANALWLVEGEPAVPDGPAAHADGVVAKGHAAGAPMFDANASVLPAADAAAPLVDVLAVYTPAMVALYGSAAAAETQIAFQAARANQAFVDSLVKAEIRIVAMRLLDIPGTLTNDGVLALLHDQPTDPLSQQVAAWRDQFGADLVSVSRGRNTTDGTCGLAYIGFAAGYDDASLAYASVSCPESFVHEIGHTFGAQHDLATTATDGAYSYSHGYRLTLDARTGFYTIMAYRAAPQTQLFRFSNPLQFTCAGQACGLANRADNALTINRTAARVAAYRATVVPVLPRLSVADVRVTEGTGGTVLAAFTVTLSGKSASDVSFTMQTADSADAPNAAATTDYGRLLPVVRTIPAGTTTRVVYVGIKTDAVPEPNEFFDLVLSAPVGATLADGYGTATIVDDDGPALSISDTTVVEGGPGGAGTATFTVSLAEPATQLVTFNIRSADGTATAGADYLPLKPTASSIPVGGRTRDFAVTILDDNVAEATETFSMTLTSVMGANLVDGVGIGTIASEDTPVLTVADVLQGEGDYLQSQLAFDVRLSGPAPAPVNFQFATAAGTATAGSDYVSVGPVAVAIAAGQSSAVVKVPVIGDLDVEKNETFTGNVTAVTGAVVGDGSAIAYVLNDDGPTLSVADASTVEGNPGTPHSATFTAKLSKAAAVPVTFSIATVNQTALAGSDYTAIAPTTATIPAGALGKVVSVPVTGDDVRETNETFLLTLGAAAGATVFDGVATGKILDDDGPTLSVADASISEGNGRTQLHIAVQLSQPVSVPVYYTISTVGGTATPGTDFVSQSATRSFQPGAALQNDFIVDIVGDTTYEPDEVFYVVLSEVTPAATVLDDRAIATILDDEGGLLDSVGCGTVVEGDGGIAHLPVHVGIRNVSTVPVSFTATMRDWTDPYDDATNGADYVGGSKQLQFPAGATSMDFTIDVLGDVEDEPNEHFFLKLTGVSGAKTTANALDEVYCTIIDDDGVALRMTAPASVVEGNSGQTHYPVSFTLAAPAPNEISFNVSLMNNLWSPVAADVFTDLVPDTNYVVRFAAGETGPKTYDFFVIGDTDPEADELFGVQLYWFSGGAKVPATQMILQIDNDD